MNDITQTMSAAAEIQKSLFNRKRNGYDPQKVNSVLSDLYKQNENLKNQNKQLCEALEICNKKISQLSKSTEALEEARIQESLRIADIMLAASKNADETILKARRQAEELLTAASKEAQKRLLEAELEAAEIRERVNIDIAAVNEKMNRISLLMQTAHDRSETYFNELNSVLESTDRDVLPQSFYMAMP